MITSLSKIIGGIMNKMKRIYRHLVEEMITVEMNRAAMISLFGSYILLILLLLIK